MCIISTLPFECTQHMIHSEVQYVAMEDLIRKYSGTLFYGTSEISLHLHGKILFTHSNDRLYSYAI